ncbi:MAG: MBL fold metallo-hydrolase, partial [Actinobacteria bacterium]|nr:MBL fold metallo-hydrolase [Actinomycetota bacterium]
LVLTHILPTLDRAVSLVEATAAFDGPVELAEDGTTLRVGP